MARNRDIFNSLPWANSGYPVIDGASLDFLKIGYDNKFVRRYKPSVYGMDRNQNSKYPIIIYDKLQSLKTVGYTKEFARRYKPSVYRMRKGVNKGYPICDSMFNLLVHEYIPEYARRFYVSKFTFLLSVNDDLPVPKEGEHDLIDAEATNVRDFYYKPRFMIATRINNGLPYIKSSDRNYLDPLGGYTPPPKVTCYYRRKRIHTLYFKGIKIDAIYRGNDRVF